MRHITTTPNHTVYRTRMHSPSNLQPVPSVRAVSSATSRKDGCKAAPCRLDAIAAIERKSRGIYADRHQPQRGIGCALSAVALTACMRANPCYADPPQESYLPQVQVAVTVEVKPGTELSGLGVSPTLFLTAKPATYNVTYSSTKVSLISVHIGSFDHYARCVLQVLRNAYPTSCHLLTLCP